MASPFTRPSTRPSARPSTRSFTRPSFGWGRPRGDEGSVAAFVVIFALTVMILAGLVIDGGLAITKREQAADVAEQAARAAAGDVDPAAVSTGRVEIQSTACDAAAQIVAQTTEARLDGRDLAGGCAVRAGSTEVAVAVRIDYDSELLGLVGFGHFTARGNAVARPAAGIDQEENNP